jgi:hypothetical protein
MFALVKKPLLLLFALLLPLQGLAAPFMALAHCGETMPSHEQRMVERDTAATLPPCHEQHMATDASAAHHEDGQLNCHEKSSCCHIAALPVTLAVTAAARPDGQAIAAIHQLYADFLPKQPQRPPRLLTL